MSASCVYYEYWERCWNEENADELFRWLDGWNNSSGEEIEYLKSRGVKTVCDAACGFGAHTLAFASNGFEVSAFDISPRAVELTRAGLEKYGFGGVDVRVAGLSDTGYADGSFDAAAAFSVLDHLSEADARRALGELSRITRPGGTILLSFDTPEEDDLLSPHETLPDGSMVYTGEGERSGLLFRPFDSGMIEAFTADFQVVSQRTNQKGDQIVLLSNLHK